MTDDPDPSPDPEVTVYYQFTTMRSAVLAYSDVVRLAREGGAEFEVPAIEQLRQLPPYQVGEKWAGTALAEALDVEGAEIDTSETIVTELVIADD